MASATSMLSDYIGMIPVSLICLQNTFDAERFVQNIQK
jgi:hypothetical protein